MLLKQLQLAPSPTPREASVTRTTGARDAVDAGAVRVDVQLRWSDLIMARDGELACARLIT